MADGWDSRSRLDDERELEDGEIDDLEEGEITEDVPGFSGYHFSAREGRSFVENDRKILRKQESQSQRFSHEIRVRNVAKKPNYSRRNFERRVGSSFPRNYEDFPWERGGINDNVDSRRPPNALWSESNRKHRLPPGQFRRSYQNFNTHPPLVDEQYPTNYHRPYKPRSPSPRPESSENLSAQLDDDDFEFLLERYKRIQEQLDESGAGNRHGDTFVDDLIDDTFVDIPLDNNPKEEREKENVYDIIDYFEKDFHDTGINLENSENFMRTNGSGGEYLSGMFSPFKLNPPAKRVRTLSELNKMDLLARGMEQEIDMDGRVTNTSDKSVERTQPIQRQTSFGKRKSRRRRPKKNERKRRRASVGSGDKSCNRASSSDIYEKLGVAVKTRNSSHIGKNDHEEKAMLRRKERIKAWQEQQASAGNKLPTMSQDSTKDDYLEKPMDVDTDSTEGVGKIEESNPPLPLVEVPPPPPPADDRVNASTSHLMPLMAARPYGYYPNYFEHWMSAPPSLEHSLEDHQVSHIPLSNVEDFTESNATAIPDEEVLNDEVADEEEADEADDEASVQALREQLLKSMVTKRAAKSEVETNEKNMRQSVASDNSCAVSPCQDQVPRSQSPSLLRPGKILNKTAPMPKLNVAPPKHDPVVIRIGEDSDDSVESENESLSQVSDYLFGGLDSLIKEARERASKPKSPQERNKTISEPTTPDALSALPQEKRSEYKRLKKELALREEQLQKSQTQGEKQLKKQNKLGKPKLQQQKQESPRKIHREKIQQQGTEPKPSRQQQQQQKQIQQQKQPPQVQQVSDQEKQQKGHTSQKDDKTNEMAKTSKKVDQSKDELEKQVKNLSEKLIKMKMLIGQDQKLLDNTKNQLTDSSKALEEHESRVALLRQQLQRAERLKMVQKDLVNKLQIQDNRLSQRMLKREATARELEEALLRCRALLVARKTQKTNSVNPGGESSRGTKSPAKNLRLNKKDMTNHQHPNTKTTQEIEEKMNESSRSSEESISSKTKKMEVSKAHLQRRDNFSSSSTVGSLSPLTNTQMQDILSMEKTRLKKLEEELSKRLRESSARHKAVLRKKMEMEERASSDSELLVKKNYPRGLTPPVELAAVSDGGSVVKEGGSVDTIDSGWSVFNNLEELEKIKKIQFEKESRGPSFSDTTPQLALPVQLNATQCIWLSVEDPSLAQQLETIVGCASGHPVCLQPLVKNEVSVREQSSGSVSGPYRSPLLHFRSYRFSPYFRTKKGLALDSLTFSHLVDPHVSFCSFALHGICSDPECPRQHINDVVPKADEILEDLAAYFPPAHNKGSGNENIGKAVKASVDAITKQYKGKVSQAELRVLFVNQLKKSKASGVYNVVLERRPWRPCLYRRKKLDILPEDECANILTETTFSWKDWERRLQMEINTRSGGVEECQEIRYFSENYDSIKTLEKATQDNPLDEKLWIRLAMLHMGSSRTRGDDNNNKDNVDKALNVLAQALEANRHSEKLWLKYLDLFRCRGTTHEVHEVCEEAVGLASSYEVWWAYLDMAVGYDKKTNVCLRMIEYLMASCSQDELKSHRLLEAFLYLVQLDKLSGYNLLALNRFQAALVVPAVTDWHKTLASSVRHLVCEDLCLLWLCYIHLVEFSYLPQDLFDPACSGPSRIVCEDGFVFPWKPRGGTNCTATKLLKLFHRALKACAEISKSRDKITPSIYLYKNLIALERACGKPESAIRSCQRLLKASPKEFELWLCLAALEQLCGDEETGTNIYKSALEKCEGHALVAYSAAKYFLEKNDLKECYDTLARCVYHKFILDGSDQGPRTRARSLQKTIIQPEPMLLYKKLLSQSLPPGCQIPALRPQIDPSKLGFEATYLWLCYSLFIELFAGVETEQRYEMAQGAYETAIHSTGERKQVKVLWTEYLYYMVRHLKDKQTSAEEVNEIFHRCLVTVPAVTPLPHVASKSWSDYRFHNEVMNLYRTCLGDSFSSSVFDKYLELFPENISMAIQAVEFSYKNNEIEKSRRILSTALLKTPHNVLLWKIAISIELKERNFDQAKQLYQHAVEALPLAATLWKDYALFQLAHDNTTDEKVHSINAVVTSARENGTNLDDFLKTLLSKENQNKHDTKRQLARQGDKEPRKEDFLIA